MGKKKWDLANYEFPIEDANRLLEPGYLPMESGYKLLKNGQIHVAILTRMPRCKGKMVDWWFGWCGNTERYKLWHPRDHVAGNWDELWKPGHYIGASHLVEEYVGKVLMKLRLTFCEPSEFFDTSKFDELGVTVVCGRISALINPDHKLSTVIHFIRDTDFGCEMRSQFWLNPPALYDIAKGIHQHCIEEMGYLAKILPDLYAQDAV